MADITEENNIVCRMLFAVISLPIGCLFKPTFSIQRGRSMVAIIIIIIFPRSWLLSIGRINRTPLHISERLSNIYR